MDLCRFWWKEQHLTCDIFQALKRREDVDYQSRFKADSRLSVQKAAVFHRSFLIKCLQWTCREGLLDDKMARAQLDPISLHLAVLLMDLAIISDTAVPQEGSTLAAVCLFIASKYSDIDRNVPRIPSLQTLIDVWHKQFCVQMNKSSSGSSGAVPYVVPSKADILHMERRVLIMVDWRLMHPVIPLFLPYFQTVALDDKFDKYMAPAVPVCTPTDASSHISESGGGKCCSFLKLSGLQRTPSGSVRRCTGCGSSGEATRDVYSSISTPPPEPPYSANDRPRLMDSVVGISNLVVDIVLRSVECAQYKPSVIAACSVVIARHYLCLTPAWTDMLGYLSALAFPEILSCLQEMLIINQKELEADSSVFSAYIPFGLSRQVSVPLPEPFCRSSIPAAIHQPGQKIIGTFASDTHQLLSDSFYAPALQDTAVSATPPAYVSTCSDVAMMEILPASYPSIHFPDHLTSVISDFASRDERNVDLIELSECSKVVDASLPSDGTTTDQRVWQEQLKYSVQAAFPSSKQMAQFIGELAPSMNPTSHSSVRFNNVWPLNSVLAISTASQLQHVVGSVRDTQELLSGSVAKWSSQQNCQSFDPLQTLHQRQVESDHSRLLLQQRQYQQFLQQQHLSQRYNFPVQQTGASLGADSHQSHSNAQLQYSNLNNNLRSQQNHSATTVATEAASASVLNSGSRTASLFRSGCFDGTSSFNANVYPSHSSDLEPKLPLTNFGSGGLQQLGQVAEQLILIPKPAASTGGNSLQHFTCLPLQRGGPNNRNPSFPDFNHKGIAPRSRSNIPSENSVQNALQKPSASALYSFSCVENPSIVQLPTASTSKHTKTLQKLQRIESVIDSIIANRGGSQPIPSHGSVHNPTENPVAPRRGARSSKRTIPSNTNLNTDLAQAACDQSHVVIRPSGDNKGLLTHVAAPQSNPAVPTSALQPTPAVVINCLQRTDGQDVFIVRKSESNELDQLLTAGPGVFIGVGETTNSNCTSVSSAKRVKLECSETCTPVYSAFQPVTTCFASTSAAVSRDSDAVRRSVLQTCVEKSHKPLQSAQNFYSYPGNAFPFSETSRALYCPSSNVVKSDSGGQFAPLLPANRSDSFCDKTYATNSSAASTSSEIGPLLMTFPSASLCNVPLNSASFIDNSASILRANELINVDNVDSNNIPSMCTSLGMNAGHLAITREELLYNAKCRKIASGNPEERGCFDSFTQPIRTTNMFQGRSNSDNFYIDLTGDSPQPCVNALLLPYSCAQQQPSFCVNTDCASQRAEATNSYPSAHHNAVLDRAPLLDGDRLEPPVQIYPSNSTLLNDSRLFLPNGSEPIRFQYGTLASGQALQLPYGSPHSQCSTLNAKHPTASSDPVTDTCINSLAQFSSFHAAIPFSDYSIAVNSNNLSFPVQCPPSGCASTSCLTSLDLSGLRCLAAVAAGVNPPCPDRQEASGPSGLLNAVPCIDTSRQGKSGAKMSWDVGTFGPGKRPLPNDASKKMNGAKKRKLK